MVWISLGFWWGEGQGGHANKKLSSINKMSLQDNSRLPCSNFSFLFPWLPLENSPCFFFVERFVSVYVSLPQTLHIIPCNRLPQMLRCFSRNEAKHLTNWPACLSRFQHNKSYIKVSFLIKTNHISRANDKQQKPTFCKNALERFFSSAI